ncbi:MAG: hypothetical protein AB7V26_01840 [Lysobacterales bacterium]
MAIFRRGQGVQLAFLLASGCALLLSLLALAVWQRAQHLAMARDDVLLLRLDRRVPSGESSAFSRGSFLEADIAALRAALNGSLLSPVRVQSRVLARAEQRLAVTLVEIEPALARQLSPGVALDCSDHVLYGLPDRPRHTGNDAGRWYGDRAWELRPADLPWLQFFVADIESQPLLYCGPGHAGEADWLLVAGGGALRPRLDALSKQTEYLGAELFSRRLGYQALGAALRDRLRQRLGWVLPALATIVLVALALPLAAALLRGLRHRGEQRLRLALGASPGQLARRAAVDALGRVLLPALLAAIAYLIAMWSGWVGPPDSAAGLIGDYLGLVAVVALGAVGLRLRLLSSSLAASPGSMLSSQFSGRIWPYLAVWAGGFLLASFAMCMAVALGAHLRRQQQIDVGFQRSGLWVIPVRLARQPDVAAPVQSDFARARNALQLAWPGLPVAAACDPPWRFEGFTFLDHDDGSTALGMPISDGFLPMLGVLENGRDLRPDEALSSRAALSLGLLPSEIAVFERLHDFVGRVGALRLGVFDPRPRKVLFQPFAPARCQQFDLVLRDEHLSAAGLARLRNLVSGVYPDAAIGEPRAVVELYRQALAPLDRLYALFAGAGLSGVLLCYALSAVVWAALLAALRRDWAIRAALGASPWRLLWHTLRRVLAWALPSTILLVLLAGAVQRGLGAWILGWQPLPVAVMFALALLLLLPGVIGLGLVAWREFQAGAIGRHLVES